MIPSLLNTPFSISSERVFLGANKRVNPCQFRDNLSLQEATPILDQIGNVFRCVGNFFLDVFNWATCGICCRRHHLVRETESVVSSRGWTTKELMQWNRNSCKWNKPEEKLGNFLLLHGIVTARVDDSITEEELCRVIRSIIFTDMGEEIRDELKREVWIEFHREDYGMEDFGGYRIGENPRSNQVLKAITTLMGRV